MAKKEAFHNNDLPPERKKQITKIVMILALALLCLAALALAAGAAYWNHMLNLMGDASQTVDSQAADTMPMAVMEPDTQPEASTSPEDTWPEVTADENITNIMIIGQGYREGEETKLSDTMILCSINREQKTLSLVSFLRDLYVPLPAYAGHGPGRNRINVCYPLGSQWTGKPEGGMEMLALCVEQNFGIPIDHSIEIGFDAFTEIIDILGGVEVELTEAEARYLSNKVGYVGTFAPGVQTLCGIDALAYARIRKIDGDIQRTGRQRTLIASILQKCHGIGLLELHRLATAILPLITTDMSNQEITNYIWELLPMLKQLEVRSIACPVDNVTLPGSFWDKKLDIGGVPACVLECNIARNRQYLAEYLAMNDQA